MVKTKYVTTPIASAITALEQLRAHYDKKRDAAPTSEQHDRMTAQMDRLALGIEALQRLDPMEFHNDACQSCGRKFSEEEITNGKFYYCPHCGQALIDWLDEEIISEVE